MLRRGMIMLVAAVSAASLASPAAAIDVDELLARSIAARGGQANWHAVETLCLKGNYSIFSTPQPFTLCRQRGGRYRFDHRLLDYEVVYGYAGKQAWWINPTPISRVPWASEPPTHYQAAIEADAEIGGPLLDAAERGHRVELVGEVDHEGERLWQLDVTLRGGAAETWFLDPETFLPRTRLSTGASGPQPAPQRVDFYDYREVAGGIRIPHRLEIEVGYGFEVMEVTEVEVNGEVDAGSFEMPLPAGMEPLRGLAGSWRVSYEGRPNPGIPFVETGELTTEIVPSYRGALLEEKLHYPVFGTPRRLTRWRSWDRFREVYRVVLFDSLTGLIDVLEGGFKDGRLTVSDVATGTSSSIHGQTFHTREETYDLTADRFKVDLSSSIDGGATWTPSVTFVYTRVE
jgi:hypothetical protein